MWLDMKNWGRGIGLMIDECRRVGVPEPEFHTNGNFVWVVFRYTGQVTMQPVMPVTDQVKTLLSAIDGQFLSVKEMMERLSLKGRDNFLNNYLKPAMENGFIIQLYPEHPKHPKQKYFLTQGGEKLLRNM